MKYYLWINGSEQGPYTLEQIQQSIERGDISQHQTSRTEESTTWDTLEQIAPLEKRVPKQSPRSPATTTPDARQRALAHLTFIRANSCYRMLRSLINVCCALCLLFVIGVVLVFCLGVMAGGSDGFPFLGKVGVSVMAVLVGLLLMAVLIAVRQSALLVIDISDTLLHEHSNK